MLTIWPIEFFPPSGDRHSPFDYIYNELKKNEQAQIILRLKTLSETEIGDWSHTWVHKIKDDIFQLTAGNQRVMYCLDSKKIVVLHACRKVKQKTALKDINRAEIHYSEYKKTRKALR